MAEILPAARAFSCLGLTQFQNSALLLLYLSALLCGMHATFPEHNPSFDPVTQVAFRPIQDGGSVIGSQDSGDYNRNQAQPCGAGAHAHKPSHAVR